MAQAKAQRLYQGDFEERDPGEVLMGTVADIDSVVQRLKSQAEDSPFLTANDLMLLRDWLELAAKWSSVVLNGRLAERQVKLAEGQGKLVIEVLRGALTDLGLDVRDPHVVQVLSTRLRALQAGQQ